MRRFTFQMSPESTRRGRSEYLRHPQSKKLQEENLHYRSDIDHKYFYENLAFLIDVSNDIVI